MLWHQLRVACWLARVSSPSTGVKRVWTLLRGWDIRTVNRCDCWVADGSFPPTNNSNKCQILYLFGNAGCFTSFNPVSHCWDSKSSWFLSPEVWLTMFSLFFSLFSSGWEPGEGNSDGGPAGEPQRVQQDAPQQHPQPHPMILEGGGQRLDVEMWWKRNHRVI